MNTDSIERSIALGAGVVSACGGLALLLDDVVKGVAPLDVKHGITIGIVSLAILAGHSVANAWRARSVFGIFGFLVFIAATGLVVVKSTGRQAEHTFASQAEAELTAEERSALRSSLARSEAMLAEAQRDLARECKSGRGKRCQGIEATIGVYEAAIQGYRAGIERLGPAKPVAFEAENFAELATVFGADKAKIKAATLLGVPFLTTALFEFGAIVGFYFAFRHRKSPLATGETKWATVVEDRRRSLLALEDSAPASIDNGGVGISANSGNTGQRVISRGEALLDVTRRLATGETVPSQDMLADVWGVDKSTVSRWLKRWRAEKFIPSANRVGRCHRLVADDQMRSCLSQ